MSDISSSEKPIDKAIRIAGGQSALARLLGKPYKQQNIQYWAKAGRVPPIAALHIHNALHGQVTKHDLCPEAYPIEESYPTSAA
jgi:DNA-binding transcriptional regulator YdaS (Cro superfamily)